jgi:hypothetical protein
LAWNFFRDVLRWIVNSPPRVLPLLYNTETEVDVLVDALETCHELFS